MGWYTYCLKLFAFVSDQKLFGLDLLLLSCNLVLELLTLGFLFLLDVNHLGLQVFLVLLHFRDLVLLIFKLLLSVIKLLFLIVQPVDLCLELVWFLFLNHLDVTLSYLLDLGDARVREAVAS